MINDIFIPYSQHTFSFGATAEFDDDNYYDGDNT